MKRSAVPLLLMSLLSLGWSSAQPLLASYERATAALRSSRSAFPEDQVASLDALRAAEAAFETLGAAFAPPLKQGLSKTFDRAEAAIINGGETDLEVQTAVLRGGFQRAVYEQALRDAGDDRLPRARSLLNVLGRDLAFGEPRFTGLSREALQSAFETRLGTLSLTRLGALGGDLEGRYRTLAGLYSHVFVVQDSPRLPPETRATVLATIRSLIAEQPIDDELGLLKGQLELFVRSATAAGREAPGAASVGSAAGTEPGTQTATGPDLAQGAAQTEVGQGIDQPDANRPDTAQPGTPQATPVDTPTGPAVPALAPTPQPGWSSLLGTPLPTLMLIGAGLFALFGVVWLLVGLARSGSRWRDLALCALLIPVAAQGLITLAVTLVPFFDAPLLARVGSYSLFSYPLTQLVWACLSIVAVCSLPIRDRATVVASPPEQTPVKAAVQTPSTPTPALRPAPVAAGNLNWDEDF